MLGSEDEETLKKLTEEGLSTDSDPQKMTSWLVGIVEKSDMQQFYASFNQMSVTPECFGVLHTSLFSMVKPEWLFPELCDCLACLKAGDTLAKDASIEKATDLLESVVDKLCKTALVREFNEKKEEYFSDEDFLGIADRALNCLTALIYLLEKMDSVSKDCEKFLNVLYCTNENLCKSLKLLSYKALFVCMEHVSDHPWTSKATICKAKELTAIICLVNRCSSIENYLTDPNSAVFSRILSDLKPRLLPSTWRQNPSIPYVFSFCVCNTRMPFLSDHIGVVLSIPLLLVDDHEVHYKCLGLEIIQHILNNSSKSELRWYGRADVLYDLLSKLLYSREPEVLTLAIPCLFSVLEIVERSPHMHDDVRKDGKHDEMFRAYVRNMSLETLISLRCIYSRHLPAFIGMLGITVVRHMEQLLTVITLYLEIFDGPAELCRFHVLEAIRQLLIQTWPRIPAHSPTIIQSLIRFIYDISSEETITPVDVNHRLLDEAVKCLQLLRQICPDKVDDLLVKLKGLNMNAVVDNCIDRVLNTVRSKVTRNFEFEYLCYFC